MTMQEEMESLYKNKTWELCNLPKGHVLTTKWVYKRKEGILEVEVTRWEAQLVVLGCNQKEGIDFNEIFSTIAHHSSIRVACICCSIWSRIGV